MQRRTRSKERQSTGEYYFNQRSSPQSNRKPSPIKTDSAKVTAGNNANNNDINIDTAVDSSSPIHGNVSLGNSRSYPTLNEIMVDDEEYVDFLNWRSSGKSYDRRDSGFCSQGKCASCCAGFSFVGMMFLIFVGILIETQPLYIKGIKPKRIMRYENDDDNYSVNTNKYRSTLQSTTTKTTLLESITNPQSQTQMNNIDSLRWLDQFYTPDHELNYHRDLRNNKNRRGESYDLHDETKVAFKTAAAYFLTMVFSLIYAQNHERFGWNISLITQRIRGFIQLRQYFVVAYDNYRRRNYNDIDETNPIGPSISMQQVDRGLSGNVGSVKSTDSGIGGSTNIKSKHK